MKENNTNYSGSLKNSLLVLFNLAAIPFKILPILILVGIVFAVWKISENESEKRNYLLSLAAPFQEACKTDAGCIVKPNGWIETTEENEYSNPRGVTYKASGNEFEMLYHIALDTNLNLKGGKDKEIEITTVHD